MKKISLFVAVFAMICSLVGCTSRGSNSSSSSKPSVSSSISSISSDISSTISSDMSQPDITSSLPDQTFTGSSSASSLPSSESSLSTPTMSADFEGIGTLSSKLLGWGPGNEKDAQNRPVGSTAYQEKYGKYDSYFIAPDNKNIYLTFDEGYENGYTASILDTLKEKQVSAVFFITGHYVKSQPDLVKRMIDEGHVVGNHSWAHLNFCKVSLMEAAKDIETLDNYMMENYNYKMSLFRFPEGAFNEQTLALVQKLGYQSLFWSFAYADWDVNKKLGYDVALARVSKGITHSGAIPLLHAVSEENSQILGQAIDNARAEGFTFSTFDLVNYNASNS